MKHHRRIMRRIARLYGSRILCRRVARWSFRTGAAVHKWEVRAYHPAGMVFQGVGEILGRAASRRDALRVAEIRVRRGAR